MLTDYEAGSTINFDRDHFSVRVNPMTKSLARMLWWEAGCVSVELAGVGAALGFALGLHSWAVAGPMLFNVCLASFFVRQRHYSHSPNELANG